MVPLVKRAAYVKLISRFKILSAPLSSSIPLSAGLVSHKFNFGGSFASRRRRPTVSIRVELLLSNCEDSKINEKEVS